MNDLNIEGPMPSWAERRSAGEYMDLGAQLPTRDGRLIGNAFVNGLRTIPERGLVADIVTDAGAKLSLTLDELSEYYHPPVYVMNISEAREKFCKNATRG